MNARVDGASPPSAPVSAPGLAAALEPFPRVEDHVNQRALTVGDVGVLLTFAEHGPRAFANVCRHRGHELLPDGGTADRAAVLCPYHGWTYRLDGALRTAAGMRGIASFDPAEHGLVALPVVSWHGWVFVNAAAGAPPFDEYAGALAGLVAPYRPKRLRLGARHSYRVAANWKVVVENYHERYHCPLIHQPRGLGGVRVRPARPELPALAAGSARRRRGRGVPVGAAGRPVATRIPQPPSPRRVPAARDIQHP